MRKHARNDSLHITGKRVRHVGDRLTRPKPDFILSDIDRMAPQLIHSDIEAHLGSQRRLLEYERYGFSGKRIWERARFLLSCGRKNVGEYARRCIRYAQKTVAAE